MKLAIAAALFAICACCEGARAQDAEPPKQEALVPIPEAGQPKFDYYVLTPDQVKELNAMFDRLIGKIGAQKRELDDLREKTKPIGNCG